MKLESWLYGTLGVVLLLSAPGVASAQCIWSLASCSGSQSNHTAFWEGDDGGEPYHSSCKVCKDIETGEAISYEKCHPCDGFIGGTEGTVAAAKAMYESLLDAAEAQSQAEMVRLAGLLPEHAFVNMARGSLQVLTCDGTEVVANIPLAQPVLSALNQRLAKLRLRVALGVGKTGVRGQQLQ